LADETLKRHVESDDDMIRGVLRWLAVVLFFGAPLCLLVSFFPLIVDSVFTRTVYGAVYCEIGPLHGVDHNIVRWLQSGGTDQLRVHYWCVSNDGHLYDAGNRAFWVSLLAIGVPWGVSLLLFVAVNRMTLALGQREMPPPPLW
jgi:hypothetical protein